MSHRVGGSNRYAKHSTGGGGSSGSVDHVQVTNLRQNPPPYLKSKVKSISDTDLGRSVRQPLVAAPRLLEHCGFAKNHLAHAPITERSDQAPAFEWTTASNNSRPTRSACTQDTQQPVEEAADEEKKDYTKLVLENKHHRSSGKQTAPISHHKYNDKSVGQQSHKR